MNTDGEIYRGDDELIRRLEREQGQTFTRLREREAAQLEKVPQGDRHEHLKKMRNEQIQRETMERAQKRDRRQKKRKQRLAKRARRRNRGR